MIPQNHNFLSSKPIPFFIADAEFKKKIERIQEDFLWRMDPKVEPRFYAYLNEVIKVREGR